MDVTYRAAESRTARARAFNRIREVEHVGRNKIAKDCAGTLQLAIGRSNAVRVIGDVSSDRSSGMNSSCLFRPVFSSIIRAVTFTGN